jgi:hypothetical protein
MSMHHRILVPAMLAILAFSLGLAAQGMTIPERVGRELAAGHPAGKPVEFEEMVDTQPLPLAKLAAAELVVVGRLTRLKGYLSDNKSHIYTEYQLTLKQVISDRTARLTPKAPGAIPPLIVTVYGGEMVVDGTPVRVTNSSVGAWDEDADVLAFLARNENDPAKFRPYGGVAGLFQVDAGTRQVTSRLNHPRKDEDLRGETLDQIVQRIRGANQ